MKKILIALLAIVMITGCSTSKKTQTLFVEKNKKYTCTYGAYSACDCVGKSACMDNSYKLQGTEGSIYKLILS